ncbi:methyltransferase [Nocardia sp. alder85J]|uniref:methyltransferase n=1 Tax=Nocardia sp. alder85J TaxID=2862949 RepID=UPI001CD423F1|nr:methyltransferase [Nocardia sp. alder85J]MCX4098078.1 methyltransferase [Nocardia sp. alder85J]
MTRSLALSTLDPADLTQVDAAVRFIGSHDSTRVLAAMVPDLTDGQRAAVAAHCRLAHAAVLVFPPDLDALDEALATHDITAGPPVPSVVVRQRLATRHGLPADTLALSIVHAAVPAGDGTPCEIEIFALVDAPEEVAAAERAATHEAHVALATGPVDSVTLTGLRALLTGPGRLRSDGGGYNEHQDSTVLYFAGTGPVRPQYRRLELFVAGHHPEVLDTHLADTTDPATRLLRLLTGAWATQALAAAAELGVADRLAVAPGCTAADLARQTGTHPDALVRLLRYLTDLEVVRPVADGWTLTETGALLATGADRSLHPLARLYGGYFYESFAHLGYAVQTGRTAFDHHFGEHHFDYFAAEPDRAALFDDAMAAGAAMFGRVGHLLDCAGATTVVDIGGGNGELLAGVLHANPRLRGVLFERAVTLEQARPSLRAAGLLDRCELVAGDFTATVPGGGDIYLLSRVLHDWDDEQCRTILRRCAAAMPAHADLYIVERLLPESGADSLAPAWDLHMLCNVGGRERTFGHYGTLLEAAGLTLLGQRRLPLDFALLHAVRR